MKKRKLGLLLALMCLAMGSMTVSAETKLFTFSLSKGYCDANVWKASKADDEQTAYITPTSTVGTGIIFAEVYDSRGAYRYTEAAGIVPGEVGDTKTMAYSTNRGVKGATYRLIGCDSENLVTSSTFQASGRWTP